MTSSLDQIRRQQRARKIVCWLRRTRLMTLANQKQRCYAPCMSVCPSVHSSIQYLLLTRQCKSDTNVQIWYTGSRDKNKRLRNFLVSMSGQQVTQSSGTKCAIIHERIARTEALWHGEGLNFSLWENFILVGKSAWRKEEFVPSETTFP